MLNFVTSLDSADYLGGALILVDKPKGWTSFDVVNKIRGLLRHTYKIKKIKVGHSGTLDPMATGLLLICTGSWTKELHQLTGLDKKYTCQITLGTETDSYDAEGKVLFNKEIPAITKDDIESILKTFSGETWQYPPAFSAIKKDGKPLYISARAGKEVVTEPRKVQVYKIRLEQYSPPHVDLLVHCGSGFYVRSLAHDIGEKIGCGAHLSALRRTSIGNYSIIDAFSMEEIEAALKE